MPKKAIKKLKRSFKKGKKNTIRRETVTLKYAHGGNPLLTYGIISDASLFISGGMYTISFHPVQNTVPSIVDKYFALYEQWRIKAVRLHMHYQAGAPVHDNEAIVDAPQLNTGLPRVFVLDVSKQYISKSGALRNTDIIHNPKSVKWILGEQTMKTFHHGRPYTVKPIATTVDTPAYDYRDPPAQQDWVITRDYNWRYKSQWGNYEMPWLKMYFVPVNGNAVPSWTYLRAPIFYDIEYVVEFKTQSDLVTGDAFYSMPAAAAAIEDDEDGDTIDSTEELSDEEEEDTEDELFIDDSDDEKEATKEGQSNHHKVVSQTAGPSGPQYWAASTISTPGIRPRRSSPTP